MDSFVPLRDPFVDEICTRGEENQLACLPSDRWHLAFSSQNTSHSKEDVKAWNAQEYQGIPNVVDAHKFFRNSTFQSFSLL
jgi:hypothetical protein